MSPFRDEYSSCIRAEGKRMSHTYYIWSAQAFHNGVGPWCHGGGIQSRHSLCAVWDWCILVQRTLTKD